MPITKLTSKDSPFLKTIRLVAAQARRAPHDCVIAEGIRSLEEALAARCTIDAVLFADGFQLIPRGAALLENLAERGVRLYNASQRLLQSVSDVQTSQGIISVVRVPVVNISKLVLPRDALILCACAIQDPGNLGTLIRTAAAAGVSLVCTTRGTVSARNPKAVRSAAGAFFRLPVAEHLDPANLLQFFRERGTVPLLADARGERCYADVDYCHSSAILLGNEARGATEPLWAGVETIRIPMAKGIESLNVAVAGALLLFEAFRQRAARAQRRTPMGK